MIPQSKYIPSPTKILPNPFVHNPQVPFRYWIQVVLMSVFVAPVRLIGICFCLLLGSFLAHVILYGLVYDPDVPLTGWRRKGKNVVSKLVVYAHFCAGWHRPKIRGVRAPRSVAPIIVAAPHTSYFDSLPFCLIGGPSVVGKNTLLHLPIIGRMLALIQPVLVDRDCADSRKATVEKIKGRVRKLLRDKDEDHQNWEQVLVFPEGTCTNRTQLLQFKPGAFYPQYPIQPVAFHWPDKPNFVSWTFDGMGTFQLLWLTLCRFENHLEIEFLPVHYPTAEEKADATLFAENVRQRLSEALGIPAGLYSLDDFPYITRCSKPKSNKLLVLRAKLGCSNVEQSSIPELHRQWDRLHGTFPSNNFSVDFLQFCQYLSIDCSADQSFRLFTMFDWNYCGSVDLREYIVASLCAPSDLRFIRLCKRTMYASSTGNVDCRSAVQLLRFPCQIQVAKIESIYKQAKSQDLNFDDLCAIIFKRKRVPSFHNRVAVSQRAYS